jgi:hypothetical protein
MAATGSNTNSVGNATGGHTQKVPNPFNPSSNALASYYSSIQAVPVPFIFSTTAYTVFLPQNAFIEQVIYIPSVAFSGGSFEIGTTGPGSSNLLTGVALTSGSINTLAAPILTGTTQELFITITGAPTTGTGFLVINYFITNLAALSN